MQQIVEKVGTKLVDILHKANPWAGEDCQRTKCLLCSTKKMEGKRNGQDFHKRICVYQTYCRTCSLRQDEKIEERFKEMGEKRVEDEKRKAKKFIYIGEMNRSMYE